MTTDDCEFVGFASGYQGVLVTLGLGSSMGNYDVNHCGFLDFSGGYAVWAFLDSNSTLDNYRVSECRFNVIAERYSRTRNRGRI